MPTEKKLTGYPSIDKPWLKYYSEEVITAKMPECSMYEFAFNNNKQDLDSCCFEYFGAKITHKAFFNMIIKAVNAFRDMGIKKGDIVTIMSMHTPETLATIYALNYIGATANMIYMTLAENEIVNYISNTNSKAFFVLDIAIEKAIKIKQLVSVPIVVLSLADSMPLLVKTVFGFKTKKVKHSFIKFREFISKFDTTATFNADSDCDNTAIIVYTSGTTGSPKGVMLSNYSINSIAFACSLTEKKYQRGQTFLQPIPPFLGFGITMSHLGVSLGQITQLIMSPDPDEIAKAFMKLKSNRMVYGPRLTDSIMKYVTGDISHLIDFTGGGEAIALDKEMKINEFLKAHNAVAKYTTGYGMTESASAVAMNTNNIYKIGSAGIPLPTMNIKVVDDGVEQPCNQIGELLFSGPSIMQGYYNNKEATEDAIEVDFEDVRWLHTGDLGYVDEDGFVFITGRLKRIFTVFGKDKNMYKLFPQRIEEFIATLSNVNGCAVVVKEDKEKLHKAIAFVSLASTENSEVVIGEIKSALAKELPEHMQPETFILIDEIPLTTSGKVDYRALEKEAEKL